MKFTRVLLFEFCDDGLIVDVAPKARQPRCSGCYRRAPKVYDRRSRLWRHLDFGGMALSLRYDLRRVDCPRCGVVGELVPWAEAPLGVHT